MRWAVVVLALALAGCDVREPSERYAVTAAGVGSPIKVDGQIGETWILRSDGEAVFWYPIGTQLPPKPNPNAPIPITPNE